MGRRKGSCILRMALNRWVEAKKIISRSIDCKWSVTASEMRSRSRQSVVHWSLVSKNGKTSVKPERAMSCSSSSERVLRVLGVEVAGALHEEEESRSACILGAVAMTAVWGLAANQPPLRPSMTARDTSWKSAPEGPRADGPIAKMVLVGAVPCLPPSPPPVLPRHHRLVGQPGPLSSRSKL